MVELEVVNIVYFELFSLPWPLTTDNLFRFFFLEVYT